jgi:hypothetical protein
MCAICDALGQWVCRCGCIVVLEDDGWACPACGRASEEVSVELPGFVADAFVSGEFCSCSEADFGVWVVAQAQPLVGMRGCYRCRAMEYWSGSLP